MYRGVSAVHGDEKGRMGFPTRYRERLKVDCNNQLVITIDTEERCLLIYPLPVWEGIEAKLSNLPSLNPQARRIQRLLLGHATEVDMDAQGRVLLPPLLREYARLAKKLILLGQGNKFELWDEDTWQARRESWLNGEHDDAAQLPDEVRSLIL